MLTWQMHAVQAEEEQGKADKAEKASSRHLSLLASAASSANQDLAAGASPIVTDVLLLLWLVQWLLLLLTLLHSLMGTFSYCRSRSLCLWLLRC